MAYSDDITALLPDHYWTMDNIDTDGGSSSYNRPLLSYIFDNTQIANDSTYSLTLSGGSDYARITDVNDMNATVLSIRLVGGWARITTDPTGITQPVCIYKEGGGTNNIAFFVTEDMRILCQLVSTAASPMISSIYVSDPLPLGRPNHLFARFAGLLEGNFFEFYLNGQLVDFVIGFDPNSSTMPAHIGDVVWGDSFDLNLLYGAAALPTNSSDGAMYSHWASWSYDILTSNEIETELFGKGALNYSTVINQTELNVYSGATIVEKPCAMTVDVSGDIALDFINITFEDNGVDIIYTGIGTLTINKQGVTVINRTIALNGGTVVIIEPDKGIQFSNLVAGSQVVVYATGTTTERFREDSSGTSETYIASIEEGIDYTIQKVGYMPFRITGYAVGSTQTTVIAQQLEDRSYVISSGLIFGTNTNINTGTKIFTLGIASTLQNYHSHMIEEWISQLSLRNIDYQIIPNGINSFTLQNGWEFDSADIQYLSRDGMRYIDSGTTTAKYAAIFTVGDTGGLQVNYQQQDGSGTTPSATIGLIDELIQIYGDVTHGNFDYTDHLVCKIQEDGYDQAEADVYNLYGLLSDELYVVGLAPLENGLTIGDPSVTGVIITDHGASPVTWNSKEFSITITDSAVPHTGEKIMRWLRYNFSLGGTFEGKDAFNWHDLVQINGAKFKTVRGVIYGDVGAALKGVRVVLNDGTTEHPDFNLFSADDGTSYTPAVSITVSNTNFADGTRIRLYNVTQDVELDNSIISGGGGYSYWSLLGAGENIEEDDVIRMTSAYNSGTIYYNETDESAVVGISNIVMLIEQSNNTVLNGYGIDGSAQIDFAIDYPNVEVDLNSGDTTREKLLCWLAYIITTADGIRNFFGAVTHQDSGNVIINASIVNLLIDYVGTGNSKFTDTIWLRRDDGANIFGGAGDNFYANSDKVYIAETGVSGLTAPESARLLAIPIDTAPSNEYDTELAAIQADLDNPDQYKADVSSVATGAEVQAIKIKTDNIPTSPASSNEYDTVIAVIQADLDNPDQYKADVSAVALETSMQGALTAIGNLNNISAIEVWEYLIETGYSAKNSVRILLAASAGKLSGADGTTITIRDLLDTQDIIVATVDENGNRTEITLDVA